MSGGLGGAMPGAISALPPPMLPGGAPMAPSPKAVGGIIDTFAARPDAAPIVVRSDFSALALFAPSVETDENGNAQVHLHLPDSLTRYRIMAVAASGEDCFGSAESSITARLPLMVKPSAPRFLNFGDNCELPVVLQNQTGHDMKVDVVARATNALISNAGKTIDVPANDRVEVRFPVQTKAIGAATFQFGASSDQLADAAEVSLPVLKPASLEAFAAYGEVDHGAAMQRIQPPVDVVDDIGGLKISTSSTALQSLTDAYISLEDYSYECSEQLSSRLLAMLSVGDVLSAFGLLPESEKTKFKTIVQADLKVLLSRQREDGGFGLWRVNEEHEWPFVSVQVVRALLLAKEKDFAVPDSALAQGLTYLRNIDRHLEINDYNRDCRWSTQAYALFVRYLQNDVDTAGAARIVKQAAQLALTKDHQNSANALATVHADRLRNVLPIESAAWLLPILSKDKKTSVEAGLLQQMISNQMVETASTASVQSDGYGGSNYFIFYSSNRQDAVVLESLIQTQADSELIPKLAKGLLAHRKNGQWESTQENSYALLALNRYFNKYEKTVPKFDAQIWLGKTFLGAANFIGRTTATKTISLPIKFVEEQGTQDLILNKDGAGRLYYRIGLEYSPKKLDLPACDYGFIVHRTYEGVDNKSDVTHSADGVWHFKAGASVRVKLTLSCDGPRYHVALMDPLAAGTEPLNPELGGARTLMPEAQKDENATESGMPNLWWIWRWFDHQNLRDHQAEAFTSLLYSGTYDYSYVVRATTPGNYIVPPAKAEEMYAPETFGRTVTDHVVVN
jgi:alpha-2-macroglobulin